MEPIVAIQLSERMTAEFACRGFSRRHIPPVHDVFRLAFGAPDGTHFRNPRLARVPRAGPDNKRAAQAAISLGFPPVIPRQQSVVVTSLSQHAGNSRYYWGFLSLKSYSGFRCPRTDGASRICGTDRLKLALSRPAKAGDTLVGPALRSRRPSPSLSGAS
jgi:hypothetical protein